MKYCMRTLLLSLLIFNTSIFGNSAALTEQLYAKLKELKAKYAEIKNMHIGIEVRSIKNNEILFEKKSKKLAIPASNTKIITALHALNFLGPDYQFSTSLATDTTATILPDSLGAHGVLTGNLYFKATGDPSLTSAALASIIKRLKNDLGVLEITGNICIDTTAFDNQPFSGGSLLENIGALWNMPISAFIVDRKPVSIFGTHNLNQAVVHLDAAYKDKFFDIAEFLLIHLKNEPIKFNGSIIFAATPKEAQPLLLYHSEPIKILLKQMMKMSDNLYADCLFKLIGAQKFGAGTWDNGIAAVQEFMHHKIGIHWDEFIIQDGSGISRHTRLSPRQICTALYWASQQPFFKDFIESFPIAGIDGTIQERMKELAYLVRAKTGTLAGVSALSGFAVSKNSQHTCIFSILLNNFIQSKAMAGSLPIETFKPHGINYKTAIEDELCKVLVEYVHSEN